MTTQSNIRKRAITLLAACTLGLFLQGCITHELSKTTASLADETPVIHSDQVIQNLVNFQIAVDEERMLPIPAQVRLASGVAQLSDQIRPTFSATFTEGASWIFNPELYAQRQWTTEWKVTPVVDATELQRLTFIYGYVLGIDTGIPWKDKNVPYSEISDDDVSNLFTDLLSSSSTSDEDKSKDGKSTSEGSPKDISLRFKRFKEVFGRHKLVAVQKINAEPPTDSLLAGSRSGYNVYILDAFAQKSGANDQSHRTMSNSVRHYRNLIIATQNPSIQNLLILTDNPPKPIQEQRKIVPIFQSGPALTP
ncbi:MAG: hypothetical protein AAGK09_04430 [Planctomycetota bacterium]